MRLRVCLLTEIKHYKSAIRILELELQSFSVTYIVVKKFGIQLQAITSMFVRLLKVAMM